MLVGGKLSPITPSLNINTFVVVSEQHHVELASAVVGQQLNEVSE